MTTEIDALDLLLLHVEAKWHIDHSTREYYRGFFEGDRFLWDIKITELALRERGRFPDLPEGYYRELLAWVSRPKEVVLG